MPTISARIAAEIAAHKIIVCTLGFCSRGVFAHAVGGAIVGNRRLTDSRGSSEHGLGQVVTSATGRARM